MSLRAHLLNESFFLKLRYKDKLFLSILIEIANRFNYDTNRWSDMSMTVWDRSKTEKLEKILEKAKFKKLVEVLLEYVENENLHDNISDSNRRELKRYFQEILRKDKYSYNEDRDKETVRRIYDFL